jgi:protease-4
MRLRFLLLFYLLLGLALPGCFDGLLIRPVRSDAPLKETVAHPAEHWLTLQKVAVIDVGGLLVNMKTGSLLGASENPVAAFREKLDQAAKDEAVKAVVLRINSPGGAVTASDIMWHDLIRFRAETSKPVVACMMDVAASGAYYLACGCDRVVAHPTTVTGSIGVVMSVWNFRGLFDKLGVESEAIKSGPNKDLGSPTHPLNEEQREILQGMINTFYDRFVEVVTQGRPELNEKLVRLIADGRVYSAAEAKDLGLVDEIGYLEDAIQEAKAMAGIGDAKVVMYAPPAEGRHSIYAALGRMPAELNLLKVNLPGFDNQPGPAFMYLWRPGLVDASSEPSP